MEVPSYAPFSMLFFCVSNIIKKKKEHRHKYLWCSFGGVFLFSLSNIVILLLVEDLNTGLNIELQDRRGEVLCLLSCLSFNKVGPPSSRRQGTRQPTLWKMTLGLTFTRKCRIGKAFFFIHN